ncbi:MAG: class I SAM-dependent methyltransferase, partial [Bacteroidota bacterium]
MRSLKDIIKNRLMRAGIPRKGFAVIHTIMRRIFHWEYEKNMSLNYLNRFYTNTFAQGPLQRDEAIFITGLLRVLRPKVCVEFGFLRGHSAFAILNAINEDAYLHSYDINETAALFAKKYFSRYPNFIFHLEDQTDIQSDTFKEGKIDFVLFDASHNAELNKATFKKIVPLLAENAMIAIHDTGLWNKKMMKKSHTVALSMTNHKEINGNIAHQIMEREFVNWIITEYPDFEVMHFHSLNV